MRDRPTDQHRTVAARHLGRPIKPGHDIDHLNENKADNSPANLKETPHGAHSAKSAKNRGLAKLQKALGMVRRGEKLF